MSRVRRPLWALPPVAVLAAGLALGCDSESRTPTAVDHDGEPVVGLLVSASAVTVQAGESIPLSVEGVCAHGHSMGEIDVVQWTVDDPRLAAVGDDGSLSAIHSGRVTVTAKSPHFAGSLEIDVLPFGATFGEDGGVLVSLDGGASVLVPEDALGHHLPVTLESVFAESLGEVSEAVIGMAYQFQTADPCHKTLRMTIHYGTVSGTNAMEAPWLRLHRLEDGVWVALPDSEVDAEAKTVSGSVENGGVYAIMPTAPRVDWIDVAPASAALNIGETVRFVATAYDRYGMERADCPFAWNASDAGVAAISSEGDAVALGIGVATVTATCEGVSGHAGLVVGSSVHSIVVDEAAITLVVGDTYALSALPISKTGAGVARPLKWKSDDMTTVRVDAAGVVTAMKVGRTKVRAESDGHWTKVTVTVVPAPVPAAYLRITPLKTMLRVGEEVQLVATFYDAQGNPMTGGPVTWSPLNPTVAAVDANGRVQALSHGLAVIEAVSGPLSATAEVIVGGPVAMRILPASSEMNANEELHLVVQFFDAEGELTTGGPVTWRSLNPEVMSVNRNGVVTPLMVGIPAMIEAVSGQLYAEAEVFCRPGDGGGSGGGNTH